LIGRSIDLSIWQVIRLPRQKGMQIIYLSVLAIFSTKSTTDDRTDADIKQIDR
jgi:hypothetical protein